MTKFDPSEWLNTFCGDYRLNILLGQGRAGGVFIAENIKTKELAAVKVYVPGRYADAAKTIARERERLNHPSIVAQLASGSVGAGYFYTVQEYAAYKQVGGCNDSDCLNLEEYLNKAPGLLDQDTVADLLTQLTDALNYAHSAANLPYGGLNPHGIMVTENSGGLSGRPRLRLTDIGLPPIRTPNDPDDAYVSPEEIQGCASEQSDIFAMGAIAHLMLTGAPPHGNIASLADLRSDVSPGWESLILKSLSYSLEERYSGYQDFLRAITHVDDIPPVVKEESSSNIWFYLSCLICVLLVLGFAFKDPLRNKFPFLEKVFPYDIIKPLPPDKGKEKPAEEKKQEAKSPDVQKESKPVEKTVQNDFSDLGSISIAETPATNSAPAKPEQELLTANGTALSGVEEKLAKDKEAAEAAAKEAAEKLAAEKAAADKAAKEAAEKLAAEKAAAEAAAKKEAEKLAAQKAQVEQAAKEAAKETIDKLAAKVDEAVLGKSEEAPAEYTVKKGDSLWAIARNYKLKVEDIQKWNGMSDNSLKPGMVLKLKEPAEAAPETKAAEPEAKENTESAEASGDGTYTVQNGDTYYSLGKKFGLSAEKLKELNDGQELKAGQVIKVRE